MSAARRADEDSPGAGMRQEARLPVTEAFPEAEGVQFPFPMADAKQSAREPMCRATLPLCSRVVRILPRAAGSVRLPRPESDAGSPSSQTSSRASSFVCLSAQASRVGIGAVSYTHLTLPTICSV